jgi:hypothetical protein
MYLLSLNSAPILKELFSPKVIPVPTETSPILYFNIAENSIC